EISAEEARTQQSIAEDNQAIAQSLALVANARNTLNEHDPNLALALALEAAEIHEPPLPEVERTLAITVYGPAAAHRLAGHEMSVTSAAITPDGQQFITASAEGVMILWD